jgi:outer membrane biosynthesis protein TonB
VVILHVLICKTGDVMTVDLITGHPSLAPAAIEAVKQWRYKPYLLDGKPVEVDSQVQISFTLAG